MKIQTINHNNYNNYQVKTCNTKKTMSGKHAQPVTFTPSVSFKGVEGFVTALYLDNARALRLEIEENYVDINTRFGSDLIPAIIYVGKFDKINCFKELYKHKDELNLYAENPKDGLSCFGNVCCFGYEDIAQELVNDPDYNINYQSKRNGYNGLMLACANGMETIVDIILTREDVDLTLKNRDGKTAVDVAKYDSIVQKLQAYEEKMKQKYGVQKQPDKNSITDMTQEEKVKFAKEILKNEMQAVEDKQAELKQREANLNKEIKSEADKLIQEEKAQLEQAWKEFGEKDKALDTLVEETQGLIAQGIEDAKNGIRKLYKIETDEFPKHMGIGGQMVFVTEILNKYDGKLTNSTPETNEAITLALQDDSGQISKDGIMFLNNIFETSKENFSTEDLLSAIKSVKNIKGFLDLDKVQLFIATLSWKGNTIKRAVDRVEKYAAKL